MMEGAESRSRGGDEEEGSPPSSPRESGARPREELLSMRGITKRFPGVLALDGVSLTLARGEVLALMGENGAGKSTLMKILGGEIQPDAGEVFVGGKSVALEGIRAARGLGIALIHQELTFAPNLDVAGNLFLGSETPESGSLLGLLPRRAMRRRAEAVLERVGLRVSPDALAASLSPGQLQLVEVAKALARQARILVMDEPTASLTMAESEQLFRIIAELSAQGVGIIYISHRLDEVMQLADRITVLRDGRHVGDMDRMAATEQEMVKLMVGRDLSGRYFPPRRDLAPSESILQVEGLLVPGASDPVSFSARKGEILGFAGLVGAGRTELMCTIFGIQPALGGRMLLRGEPFAPARPMDAISRGIFLAPEERKLHGLVLAMSIAENVSLPNRQVHSRWGALRRGAERKLAREVMDRLAVKAPSPLTKVMSLSGGNQQKVVLGKWLAHDPTVLIVDEPTRGVDVGAKAEIYRHLVALADRGITILMVSSDMEEVLHLSDRVVVMRERKICGIVEGPEQSSRKVMELMTGVGGGPGEEAA